MADSNSSSLRNNLSIDILFHLPHPILSELLLVLICTKLSDIEVVVLYINAHNKRLI